MIKRHRVIVSLIFQSFALLHNLKPGYIVCASTSRGEYKSRKGFEGVRSLTKWIEVKNNENGQWNNGSNQAQ